MTRFSFSLAERTDDERLRQFLAESFLPGRFEIVFSREPSYFDSCSIHGDSCQIIKCVDLIDRDIVAVGARTLRRVYLNGQPSTAGYLYDLRLSPKVQKSTVLARGYRFLEKLHKDKPASFYLTLILDSNEIAKASILGGRAGLPNYKSLGKILTPTLLQLNKRRFSGDKSMTFFRGADEHWPTIYRFLANTLPSKQFAPIIDEADLYSPKLRGLKAEDFFLAVRQGEVVATLAAWNQVKFRQTRVQKYPRLLRPIYNSLAQILNWKKLPKTCQNLPLIYLSFAVVQNNDPEIFRELLKFVFQQHPNNYCILSLHESDPLTIALKDYKTLDIAGELFLVSHSPSDFALLQVDARVPFFDVATA